MIRIVIRIALLMLMLPGMAMARTADEGQEHVYLHVDHFNHLGHGAPGARDLGMDRSRLFGFRLGVAKPDIENIDLRLEPDMLLFNTVGYEQAYEGFHAGVVGQAPAIDNTGGLVMDRPYSSLAYVAYQREFRERRGSRTRALITELRLGLLGTRAAEDYLQRISNNHTVERWESQISNGGEVTLLYSITKLAIYNTPNRFVRFTGGINFRAGTQIATTLIFEGKLGVSDYDTVLSSSLDPMLPVPFRTERSGVFEHYLYVSFQPELVLYNAMIYRQFKHFDPGYDAMDIKNFISKVEGGAVLGTSRFKVRAYWATKTTEVDRGKKYNQPWGGVSLDVIF